MVYDSRRAAGRLLAQRLEYLRGSDSVVLAIPRSGVLIGAEIARYYGMPMGLVMVRKIYHPGVSEYPIGAIAKGQTPVFNPEEYEAINKDWLDREIRMARLALNHRDIIYRRWGNALPKIKGKKVIIVDDTLSTGYGIAAAVQMIRSRRPSGIIVASPVATQESLEVLRPLVSSVEFLGRPVRSEGDASRYYRSFAHINDNQVIEILKEVNYVADEESTQPTQPEAFSFPN